MADKETSLRNENKWVDVVVFLATFIVIGGFLLAYASVIAGDDGLNLSVYVLIAAVAGYFGYYFIKEDPLLVSKSFKK